MTKANFQVRTGLGLIVAIPLFRPNPEALRWNVENGQI
jgi:hypothetical protein